MNQTTSPNCTEIWIHKMSRNGFLQTDGRSQPRCAAAVAYYSQRSSIQEDFSVMRCHSQTETCNAIITVAQPRLLLEYKKTQTPSCHRPWNRPVIRENTRISRRAAHPCQELFHTIKTSIIRRLYLNQCKHNKR